MPSIRCSWDPVVRSCKTLASSRFMPSLLCFPHPCRSIQSFIETRLPQNRQISRENISRYEDWICPNKVVFNFVFPVFGVRSAVKFPMFLSQGIVRRISKSKRHSFENNAHRNQRIIMFASTPKRDQYPSVMGVSSEWILIPRWN